MNDRINFMDLKRQYDIHKDGIFDAFKSVCEETAFSGGKYVEKFEKEFAEYCGSAYASGLNNGTTALHMAMKALDIGKGDEVIVPANTFIATAWGVSYTGATPVFADCTSDTWQIDPKSIENKITNNTKAVIGVHLYGLPFDIDEVSKVCKKHNLLMVEDSAQAHGATYKGKRVGSFGEISAFSFYPGKNLGAYGEAGAVTSNNVKYIEKINMLRNHGALQRYYHDFIGYNYRMDGIQAAILSYKLLRLDSWSKRRQSIAGMYYDGIQNKAVTLQVEPSDTKSVFHLFVVTVPDRDAFMKHLENKNIFCGLHYPVPCHMQKAYSDLKYKKGDMPNAEYLSEHCVSLPMFPELRDDEVRRVIDAVNSFER